MPLTDAKQFLIELINRSRLDPLNEVALNPRLATIDGEQPAGTYSTAPIQALAWNAQLDAAAQGHNEWMIAEERFSHFGENDTNPFERAVAEGYQYNGAGENLAIIWSSDALTVEGTIEALHTNLFSSDGHRGNLLNGAWQEVGTGTGVGFFTPFSTEFNASYLTQTFGRLNPNTFLTGVVYSDADTNDFYSYGEGDSGVSFEINGTTVSSGATGGYALEIAATSDADLTVTSNGLTAEFIVDLSAGNVKFDVVDDTRALVSGNTELISGFVTDLEVLGAVAADLTGDARANALTGSRGANMLDGAAGRDTLDAGQGNDTVFGGNSSDFIIGGSGDDLLFGGTFHDTINAGSGNDTVYGDNGRDLVRLGTGNDVFHDNDQNEFGHDVIYAWTGLDTVNGGGGNDTIWGGSGRDWLSGGAQDDRIHGGSFSDRLIGGSGNDTIWGDNGADTAFLGSGNDVFIDNAQSGNFGKDTVWGGYGDDTINGSGGDDSLSGQWGDDIIFGGADEDFISGGIGNDTMTGGADSDTFFTNATLNPGSDVITDFQNNVDVLQFDNVQFSDLTISGVGGDTRISWAQGDLLLEGVNSGLINVNDFEFV